MNHWIYLSRAHYGRKPTADATRALSVIERGVRSGDLIVPIASTNVIEAGESSMLDRRERLARFMVELSTNLSVMNHDAIALGECVFALRLLYEGTVCWPLRSQLIHEGLAPVLGTRFSMKTEPWKALFGAVQDSPEMSEFLLAHGLSHPNQDDRRVDEKALQAFKEIRALDAQLPLDERRRREIRNTFEEGHIADLLYKAARELGIPDGDLRKWLESEENRHALHARIPSCDVALELIVARARNRDHVNDLKDYGFLKVVVPYANYVATEKSWASLLNKTGVSRKYGTHVFGNLGGLAQQLESDLRDRDKPQ